MCLLEIMLTCNYFMFENNYINLRGMAMGSNVALTYANIIMANLEESIIYVSYCFSHMLRWWRYNYNFFSFLKHN